MKNIIRIWIITLISVMTPILSWYAYDIFVLGHCDSKFGCVGSFYFILFLYGSFAVITAFASSISYYYIYKKNIELPTKSTYIIAVLLGFVLGSVAPYYFRNFLNELPVMILVWFIASLFLSMFFYEIQRYITKK